jgi:hypothetical protein
MCDDLREELFQDHGMAWTTVLPRGCPRASFFTDSNTRHSDLSLSITLCLLAVKELENLMPNLLRSKIALFGQRWETSS